MKKLAIGLYFAALTAVVMMTIQSCERSTPPKNVVTVDMSKYGVGNDWKDGESRVLYFQDSTGTDDVADLSVKKIKHNQFEVLTPTGEYKSITSEELAQIYLLML